MPIKNLIINRTFLHCVLLGNKF